MGEVDAAEAAERLRALLAAVDRGELDASAAERARLEGAALALEMLARSQSTDP